jgi:REP element-mobilizing transposase RayT
MIFRDNPDRLIFLSKLDEYAERRQVSILTYCLMDNHFHLLLRQDGPLPINSMMQPLLTGYVRSHNMKHGLVGRLFQSPYKAKLVHDDTYLCWVSRYIHLNPNPHSDYQTYRWSSFRQFVGEANGICDIGPVLDCFGGSKDSYAIYVKKGLRPGLPAVDSTSAVH